MSQLDVDVLGADLGLGTPVVAFQVKKSAADWDMTYLIYSLQKPPQLLRTITGGDFFRAADTDLKGRVEIWTGDVRAISGFEGFLPGEFDFAPTVVLRFERNRLTDVSAEYQPRFDEQIAKVLGCSLSATKSLIHRGRETLKVKLKPYLRSGSWEEPENETLPEKRC